MTIDGVLACKHHKRVASLHHYLNSSHVVIAVTSETTCLTDSDSPTLAPTGEFERHFSMCLALRSKASCPRATQGKLSYAFLFG